MVAIEENSDFEERPKVEQPRTPPRPQRPLNPPPPPRCSQRPCKNWYLDDSIYGRRPIVEIENSIPKTKTKKSLNMKPQLRIESPVQEMSLADSNAGRESDSSKEAFDDAQEGHSGNFDDALTYIVKEGGNNLVQHLLSMRIPDETVPVV